LDAAAEVALVRCLFITPFPPTPPRDGGRIRIYELLAALAERHEVRVLSLIGDRSTVSTRKRELDAIGVEGSFICQPAAVLRPGLAALAAGRSYYFERSRSNALARALAQTLREDSVDVLQFEYAFMGQYIPQAGRGPISVLDEHNVEFQVGASLASSPGSRTLGYRKYIGSEIRRRRVQELRACRAADHVICCSVEDLAILRSHLPGLAGSVVPNGVRLPRAIPQAAGPPRVSSAPPRAVFVGKMDYRPNAEAVEWFCARVLPLVQARFPSFQLTIVGAAPPSAVRRLGLLSGVRVVGEVPETTPYLNDATLAVAPLLAGSGTRLKVLEALAHGCPVVSTTFGCSGLGAQAGEDLVVADSPDAFADGVISLLTDPARRAAMARTGRRFAEQYDWRRIGRQFEDTLLELIDERRVAPSHRSDRPRRLDEPSAPGSPPPDAQCRPRTSLVTTVRNEVRSITPFLESILSQSLPPDEIVVVDGGSSDGTLEALRALAADLPSLMVASEPAVNISAGRNAAIRLASGEIIAVTDAGTQLAEDWLEQLVRPLVLDLEVSVSAGFFSPGGDSVFSRLLAAVIVPHLTEIDPMTFLPSSRSVAFRRRAWEIVGGYPEWLDHCEDLVFDLALKHAGLRFTFTPTARVTWDARRSLPDFFRQYYLYARGDGVAGLWARRHAVRYGAYGSGVTLFLLGRRHPVAWIALAVGSVVHTSKFIRRVWRHRPFHPPLLVAGSVFVPVIVVVGDLAKMVGYPVGRIQRAATRGPRKTSISGGRR
jgi:glycosyltransferase involved in cell wall biosynthesis